jgi:hypothetical protein
LPNYSLTIVKPQCILTEPWSSVKVPILKPPLAVKPGENALPLVLGPLTKFLEPIFRAGNRFGRFLISIVMGLAFRGAIFPQGDNSIEIKDKLNLAILFIYNNI